MSHPESANKMRWLWFLPALLFLGLVVFMGSRLGEDPNHLPSALVGHDIPSFDLPMLSGNDEKLSNTELLAMFKGEYFLINVWASWCPSCYQEHSYLMHLSGLIDIAGINYKDTNNEAINFLSQQGNPFAVVIVDQQGSLGMDLGVTGAPETFLVDSQGKILQRYQGDMNEAVWQQKFIPLMVSMDQNDSALPGNLEEDY